MGVSDDRGNLGLGEGGVGAQWSDSVMHTESPYEEKPITM